MIQIDRSCRILFASSPVDFRKSFDGLCGVVRNSLGFNPQDGSLYVFYNRRRDRVKLLVWDTDGFWLHYKCLEIGTFELPRIEMAQSSVVLPKQDLELLLSGIILASVQHKKRYK